MRDHGLVSFDGINVTTYDVWNSGISGGTVNFIAIDSNNSKWISCWEGYLVAFNEIGFPAHINNKIKNDETLLLYPNPASQRVNIHSKDYKVNEVSIYSITGSRVKSEKLYNNSFYLGDVPPGVYIIEMRYKKNMVRKKLIVYR
jgi:hypothetical protein